MLKRCTFLIALFGAGFLSAETPADPRPNILWIVVEDASCHINLYGDNTISTPHLDALAAQGVTFSSAFVSAPVCSASRSAMISGMVQSTLGVQNHRSQMDSGKGRGSAKYFDSYRLPVRMIPELFKAAGYHTSNNKGPMPGGGPGKADYNFVWSQFKYDSAHWLDCPEGLPFFAQLQLSGGKNRGHDSGPMDPEKMKLPAYYPEHAVFKKDWAEYMNSWLKTDREVGIIIEQLKAAGKFENTAIFFVTDHGVSHLRGKQFVYDEGTHVPLIVKYPDNRDAGTKRDDMVMQFDLGPTSLALAGISVPKHMQGKDFGAQDYTARSVVFSGRDRCDETIDILRSVRTERFKYIRNFMSYVPHLQPNQYKDAKTITQTMRVLYADGKLDDLQARIFSPKRPKEELYDLKNDPYETLNLAGIARFSETLSSLREQLYRNMIESRDLGLIPEPIAEDLGRQYGSKYHILSHPENASMVSDLIRIIDAGEANDGDVLLAGSDDLDPSIRYWAVTWLGVNKSEGGIAKISKMTHDPVPAVRIASGLALCRMGQTEAGVSAILNEVDDENLLVGMYAIRALEQSGVHSSVIREVANVALESPYEFTRRIAKRLVVEE